MTIIPCPRCRVGFDQGDGKCDLCLELSDNDLREMMRCSMQTRLPSRKFPHYPSDREEAGKPRVRWAWLLVVEGSELQVAWHQAQSVFNSSRTMGNVTCYVFSETSLTILEEEFPEWFEFVQKEST